MTDSLYSERDPDETDAADAGERAVGGDSRGKQEVPERQRLPKDVIFDLLSTERRRDVLEYMATNGSVTTLGDLAEHIAAKENDTEVSLLNSQQRKRVYVALYQCHLPRMDDADVIDFESARGTVEIRPNAAQLYQYLDVIPADADETGPSTPGRFATVRLKIEDWVPKST